ncbi:MAG: hypothetical protein CVV44_03185 [Spirochaetae bacterium HGW-Spirochaetae-1]|jgi:protein arginine kinase activator|nr:MAG: hypothetical protein CVV44_03185 [Spirochaetae bacterium HGW-Spirochaetae-1]
MDYITMLCERCKKIEATIHLTEIIKDVKSEVHLCESCARDIGLNSKLSNFSLSVPEMLSFLEVNDVTDMDEGNRCMTCGMTFVQYTRQGKVGCADCYTQLDNSLNSVIRSYHGDKKHIGKIPAHVSVNHEPVRQEKVVVKRQSFQELQTRLQNAVMEERFEEAALLRDRIREETEREAHKGI